MTMETKAKDNRQYYLDNLKVFLTVPVIFHHAGQAYFMQLADMIVFKG